MIRYVIFDFDGTLADTAYGILKTTEATLKQLGLPAADSGAVVRSIGLPLKGHLAAAGIPEEMLDEAVEIYHDQFYIVAPDFITMYDGVEEILKSLQKAGIRMGVATSRGTRSLTMLLESHHIKDCFDAFGTVDSGTKPKPNPDLVEWVMSRLGASPEETLVVGDTTFDIQMGASAGCRTCAVSYGNHPREMLETANPDWIIDDIREIESIIK